MKFSIAAVLLSVSSLTVALTVTDLPACSIACFTTGIATTKCGATDYKCQCTTGKSAITASVGPCLLKACSTTDAAKAISVSADICKTATDGSSSSSSASSSGSSSKTASGTATSAVASSASSAAAKASSNAASWMQSVNAVGAGAGFVAAGMFAL